MLYLSTKAPPAAGATGPVLPVDIVVDETTVSTTVSGPVTPIDTPDGPVFPGDVTSTDATPTKPAVQAGGGAKSAPKPAAATALYAKTTIKKAGTPTKSPSSGLHKPTWKPSSKPNEHRTLSAVPVTKDDADPCHDGLSPRCTPPTSKPVEHASKQGAALPRALKQDFLQTTAILKSPEESLSAENLEATKIHAANAQALAAQGGKDEGISTKKVLAEQQQETVYAVMAEEKKAASAGDSSSSSAKKAPAPAALYSKGGKVTTGKDEKADPCHDGLSPRCTPPTSKPVEHKVSRALAGSPTKSPSSGLHKPTWRPSSKPAEHRTLAAVRGKGKTEKPIEGPPAPQPKLPSGPRALSAVPVTKDDADPCHDGLSPRCTPPTSKPVEHQVKRQLSNAHPGDLTTSTAGKGAFAEVGPSKSPSTGIHKPTWKPTQGKPSGKPVEPWKEGVESSHTESKNSAHTDGEMSKRRLSGYKAVGGPTKSPSTGIMKPTWKPSSKPAERKLKSSSKTSKKADSSSSSSSKSSSKKSSSKSSKGDEGDDAMPPPPPPATDDATPPPPPPATDDATPPPPPPATDDATPPPPPPDAPSTTTTTSTKSSSTKTADGKGCPTCATDADCSAVGYGPCVNGKCQPKASEGEVPVEGKMLLPPAKNSKLSTVSKTAVAAASTIAVVEPANT